MKLRFSDLLIDTFLLLGFVSIRLHISISQLTVNFRVNAWKDCRRSNETKRGEGKMSSKIANGIFISVKSDATRSNNRRLN